MSEPPKSRPLKLDDSTVSASSELPAFLARPKSAPVYHGFPVVPETMTDGWCFGAITEYASADGCNSGDAFVVAPDGSRAGLVWEVGEGEPSEILKPDELRWGVRSEEHTSELQSQSNLVCRLLLEKKKKIRRYTLHAC